MFKEYRRYIRDNPEGYWFKAKLYGWGWTPARWQGWLTLIVFFVLVVLNFERIDSTSQSIDDTLINFIPQTIVLTLILLFISWKTGETPHWNWGDPKKEK